MNVHLPISRVKTIIKSSADVEIVAKDSIYVITRAAEQFIKQLAKEAYKDAKKDKHVDYKNVANIVNSDNHYEFLREIIPKKITVQEYYKLINEQAPIDVDDSDESTSEDEDSSSSDEDSRHEDEKKDSSDSDVIILD